LAAGGLQFVFVPIYVSLLGPDAYGLLGFYLAVLGLLLCLDQAVTPTITRTFAQHDPDNAKPGLMWDTLRTMEWVSISLGCILGVLIFVAAPWIAANIVHSKSMKPEEASSALRCMSLTLACQWPSFMYSGALTGLRTQLALNTVRTSISFAQWLGGAILLRYFSSDVAILFVWQAGCFFVQSVLLRKNVRINMPLVLSPPRFSGQIFLNSWRFSVGALVIGITGATLTQGDKFLVSHSSSLSTFSAYSLAFLMASLIGIFVAQPIATVAFPGFVKALHVQDHGILASRYRSWTQATVLLVAPTTAALIVFPDAVLGAWMHKSPAMNLEIASYLPWIAAGTLLNLLMLLPFNLQIAAGWTSLSSIKNIIILPFFVAGLWYFLPLVGPLAGAIAWLMINAAYYAFEIPIMHRRLLPRIMVKWWLIDTSVPCLLAIGLMMSLRHVQSLIFPTISPIVFCIIGWLAATLTLAGFLSLSREIIFDLWRRASGRLPIKI